MSLRREFDLRPDDKECLDEYGVPWETILDYEDRIILIHGFSIKPSGYNHKTVTAAILLDPSYPDTEIDMVYFYPPLARKDGETIYSTEHIETIDGKPFQRWSRHRADDNPWDPEEDNVGTHLSMIEDCLEMEFEK